MRRCCQSAGCASYPSWVWERMSTPLLSSWQRGPEISPATCFGVNQTLPVWARLYRPPAWWVVSEYIRWKPVVKFDISEIEMVYKLLTLEKCDICVFISGKLKASCHKCGLQSCIYTQKSIRVEFCNKLSMECVFSFYSFATRNVWMRVRQA